MERKFVPGALVSDSTLGPRQIKVIASDATPDRDGDVMRPEGCVLANYAKNPIVLADHDPEKPIGTAAVAVRGGKVVATISFAPPGVSAKADEYCGLTKAGVLNAVSVGFRPIEKELNGPRGMTFTKWELMELSVVAVPCNPGAVVIERSSRKSGRVLSAANAAKLRAASEHLGSASRHIDDVLSVADLPDEELAADWARRQRLVEIARFSEPELSEAELAAERRKRMVAVFELGPGACP